MGKKRIAQTLSRAGLALGVSTVGRILKERDTERPMPEDNVAAEAVGDRIAGKPVQAKKPNDVWQIDLTVVPTAAGFWTAWFPFSVEQSWPFAWWVACVVDHYSRRVVGFAVFLPGAEVDRYSTTAWSPDGNGRRGSKVYRLGQLTGESPHG